MSRILQLYLILVLFNSCSQTIKKDNNEKKGQQTTDKELVSDFSNIVDTNKMVKLVADDILKKLQGQHIRKSELEENGDYFIEYNEDTINAAPDDIIWEYYNIDKNELITGKLNSDDKLDFAIRTTWGPTMGNMFGLEWHIYVSQNDTWIKIENNFGGGKFSNMEKLVSIDNGQIKTEYQELDEETLWLKDSVEVREYEIVDYKLKRKE